MEDIDSDKSLTAAEKADAKLAVSERRWKDDSRRLAIDLDFIRSKEYAARLERAFPDGMPDVVLGDAHRILRHRTGTAFEDLYAYDLTEGKRLDSAVNSKIERQVNASERMGRRIAAVVENGHGVAMPHNHPGSSIPSAADFTSLKATGARYGVIAAHDGTVYRYSVVGDPAPIYTRA